MKINMPITDHEVVMESGQTIVSKTDLKGAVSYVNRDFLEISGFSEDELIGKNHNIVRHPDVPAAAFKDLWDTVKSGKPWSGIVKNRCKNGDFYWVVANVTPIYQDGEIVEYMSVRHKPSREQIKLAEDIYPLINDGKLKLKEGRPVETGLSGVIAAYQNISLAHKLGTSIVLLLLSLAFMMIGLFGDMTTATVACTTVLLNALAVLILASLTRPLLGSLSDIKKRYIEIASGNFSEEFDIAYTNELGDLYNGLKSIQIRTGYDLLNTQKIAESALVVQNALDVCATNVLLADNSGNIIYTNQSFDQIMRASEADFSREITDFSAENIRGGHIGMFFSGVDEQGEIFEQLDSSKEINKMIAGRTIRINLTPVVNEHGVRLGTVLEWLDRTDEVKQQAEEERIANENARMKQALDSMSSSVLVTDEKRNIIYLNHAANELMHAVENDFKQDLPDFSANTTIGQSLDIFEKDNSSEVDRLFEDLSEANTQDTLIGGRSIRINLMPVLNMNQEQIGVVTEWTDRTDKVKQLAEERAVATVNARMKQALDRTSANVMVNDVDFNIVYMNGAAQRLMSELENDIQREIPTFVAAELFGTDITSLHENLERQKIFFADQDETFATEFVLGGHHLRLLINPVIDANNQQIGNIIEWEDKTQEIITQKEIDEMVSDASKGILSSRVNEFGKEGFFLTLSHSLNELLDLCETVIMETGMCLGAVAKGNLITRMTGSYKGDFDQLASNMNNTIERLSEMISKIRASSDNISQGVNEISAGNINLSQRTEAQASSLQETAASMEQMASSIKQSSESMQESNHLAQSAKERAEEGGQVVKSTITSMDRINASSKKINDIIGVIDEIAFQTNLLALNAAVEAARAGKQGRGFAVVAGEVRSLAQRSAGAAKQIKELISESVSCVSEGSELVAKSGETLTNIVNAVDSVSCLVKEVANGSAEQSLGIQEVNQAVTQMDDMTQQNAALVEEVSAASVNVAEQTKALTEMVQMFKVDKDESVVKKDEAVTKLSNDFMSGTDFDEDAWDAF